MTKALTDWYLRCPSCGGVAYWLRRKVAPGALIEARDVVHSDGSPTSFGEVMRCGTCQRGFYAGTQLDVRPSSELPTAGRLPE